MAIRAILFDLDGTIVDTERESAEAMARAIAKESGVELTQADRDFIVGRSWVAITERLFAQYPAIGFTRPELIAATAREREILLEAEGLEALPGALEAVRRFGDLALAVVTGSARVEAEHVLGLLGIRDAFRSLVPGDEIATSKPSPEGYLLALDQLGVAPSEAVVVEDSTAGIAAGVSAGCHVIAVAAGNFLGQDQSGADFGMNNLHELTEVFIRRLDAGG